MKIGVPKELKTLEGRVGLIPEACASLVQQGHEVMMQSGAGDLSGYPDEAFLQAGVSIVADAASLYQQAELIVKVKEPVAEDLLHLKPHHRLFCYLHLAANIELAQKLCDIGLTAVAFETVTDSSGALPLLTPMSEIAGKLSIQIGTHLLHQPQGGRGVMLGGLPFTERGHVVVLGAGHAGAAAARLASAIGAEVTVFDMKRKPLNRLYKTANNITTLYAYEHAIGDVLKRADLVIGAVLLPGLQAPRVVTEPMVQAMPRGSVIVDISIDQGGCVETIKPTDYSKPTYQKHDVIHFGVTNMPGAVPRTSSQALSAVITPYVHRLCEPDWDRQQDLQDGINIRDGKVDNPLIKQALGLN